MKKHGYIYLIGFVAFILVVGLACGGSVTTPDASVPQQPVDSGNSQPQPTDAPQQPSNTGNAGDYVVFTDKSNFFKIEVPSSWKQEHGSGDKYYNDSFTAPDGNAVIESIVYDDGTSFSGSQNGKFALYLLNTFYSKTGKEGDIRVSDDKIEKDGSESLIWSSKEGGYSGISNFEVRKGTTFLMLTVNWANEFKDQYSTALGHVFDTYAIP